MTITNPRGKTNSFIKRLEGLPVAEVRDYRLDASARQLWVGPKAVRLTPLQVLLAGQLLEGPKHAGELWETVWGYSTPLDEAALNTIWVNIHYLRQRIKGRVKFHGLRGWTLI